LGLQAFAITQFVNVIYAITNFVIKNFMIMKGEGTFGARGSLYFIFDQKWSKL
jgi:hypothetical protein